MYKFCLENEFDKTKDFSITQTHTHTETTVAISFGVCDFY